MRNRTGTHLFGKLVGVPAVGIHLADGLGGPAVAEEVDELVDALLVADVEARGVSTYTLRLLYSAELTPKTRTMVSDVYRRE